MKKTTVKYGAILLLCYLAMSGLTLVDSIVLGHQTALLDRIERQPFTFIGVPIFFLIIFMVFKSRSLTKVNASF